jgi:hypothetical protein
VSVSLTLLDLGHIVQHAYVMLNPTSYTLNPNALKVTLIPSARLLLVLQSPSGLLGLKSDLALLAMMCSGNDYLPAMPGLTLEKTLARWGAGGRCRGMALGGQMLGCLNLRLLNI